MKQLTALEEDWFPPDERSDREPVLDQPNPITYTIASTYHIRKPLLLPSERSSGTFLASATAGKERGRRLRNTISTHGSASAAPSRGPRHTYACAASTYCSNNLHYALVGIGSGIASSLPLLVLRSMLKQRRILMRIH